MTFPQSYYLFPFAPRTFFDVFHFELHAPLYQQSKLFTSTTAFLFHPSSYEKGATYLICNRNFQHSFSRNAISSLSILLQ